MRIGLFDSGVGGLTVLKTLKKKYPNNDYIYYGDTLNVPYGDRTKEEILTLSKNSIEFLISKKVDIIIIACGTISANCYNELKNIYKIPIYDIISPTINFINDSDYQNIGLIATQGTINSHIFKNQINKKIYEIATPQLVPLIENNQLDDIKNILLTYLKDYINKIDLLILGCTHYPTLISYLKQILPSHIELLDMSDLIVLDNNGNSTIEIYFSKLNDTIISNTKKILGDNFKTTENKNSK